MIKIYYPFLLIFIIFAFNCSKDPIEAKSSGGTYEYAFTLKRLTKYDTVMRASQISDRYKFVHGSTNEFRRGYTCSLFVNDTLTSNLLIVKRNYVDSNNNDLVTYTDSDFHGSGFTREYLRSQVENGQYFIQILDFPFPGWNRFIKTEE